MELRDAVTCLRGIGPRKAEALAKLNIATLEDLVYFLPRDYEDRRNRLPIAELEEGVTAVVTARVRLVIGDRYRRGRKQMLRLLVADDSGELEIVFFNAGYMLKTFKKGEEYMFFGSVSANMGRLQMIHPEFEAASEAARGILPVYPLTKGVTQRQMRAWQETVKPLHAEAEDILSEERRNELRLCDLRYALDNVHFPLERQKLLEARYRLIFDELLILQTGLRYAGSRDAEHAEGISFSTEADISEYTGGLPYELTEAQKRCISEIEADLESKRTMNRLVQGDVGSGKTAVAEAAMFKAVRSGYQAVLMAPTEILARQHFEGISRAFAAYGIRTGFLSGSMRAAEKRQTLEGIRSGLIQVVIGTHAVIQPEVEFSALGLVITDEQHRFGVRQRVKLKEKGKNPNVLVMTATPIPRTLSVVLYGDLDVSVIDQLPPGRQRTATRSVGADKREQCYDFVAAQLAEGRQAYVVTPLIEDSEAMEARSATEVAGELTKRFDGYRVALLHGAMKQEDKDRIMDEFYRGEIRVLVATVVIEVGINVPNATVIVVENAERFGLAQLHQLRGRVGRGKHKSYCLLITYGGSELAQRRGEIMEASNDGFYIAEEDLRLRGPGEIFGTRQHGLPNMKIADLSRHMDILKKAGEEAAKILAADPGLSDVKNRALRSRVTRLFGDDMALDL